MNKLQEAIRKHNSIAIQIASEEEEIIVQEYLFAQGCRWSSLHKKMPILKHKKGDITYLTVDSDLCMRHGRGAFSKELSFDAFFELMAEVGKSDSVEYRTADDKNTVKIKIYNKSSFTMSWEHHTATGGKIPRETRMSNKQMRNIYDFLYGHSGLSVKIDGLSLNIVDCAEVLRILDFLT